LLDDLRALVEFAQAGFIALAQVCLRGRARMSFRRQLGQLHHHADLADVSARLKVQEGRI